MSDKIRIRLTENQRNLLERVNQKNQAGERFYVMPDRPSDSRTLTSLFARELIDRVPWKYNGHDTTKYAVTEKGNEALATSDKEDDTEFTIRITDLGMAILEPPTRPRLYETPAEKQAAYRARQSDRLRAIIEGKTPPPPAIGNMPAEKRWKGLQEQAYRTLTILRGEMRVYYDTRSEQWQESDRGTELEERINAIESIIADLDDLP